MKTGQIFRVFSALRRSMPLDVFLTAYDPSDLPGSSLDPLGFDRGYDFLAEKILPGLTNVANRPRYFGMLCAGVALSRDFFHPSPREQYKERLERVKRFERFWALANALATISDGLPEEALSGLRGVTYAAARAREVLRKEEREVSANYRLLSRQVQYGAVGMYGAVADRIRLLDRERLTLTPDLGARLAEAFLEQTKPPKKVERAIGEDVPLDVATLTSWGRTAHIRERVGKNEGSCLKDALHLNPVRSRMAFVLKAVSAHSGEPELGRLERIHHRLTGDRNNLDLAEATKAILGYEQAYLLSLLAMERMLWLCRQDPAGSVEQEILRSDVVISDVEAQIPKAVAKLTGALDSSSTEAFLDGLGRLNDVVDFLKTAAESCRMKGGLAQSIMERHAEVQRGKFDRGRRKLPWMEYVKERIALTMTRVGGMRSEVTDPSQIQPHPYRLSAADALIEASESWSE